MPLALSRAGVPARKNGAPKSALNSTDRVTDQEDSHVIPCPKREKGRNWDAEAWARRAGVLIGLPAVQLECFVEYAARTTFRTWDGSRGCVTTIAKTVGCSRRTVHNMLTRVRDELHILAVDGRSPGRTGHVSHRYRLSGSPDFPLPLEVEQARARARSEFFDPIDDDQAWPEVWPADDTDVIESKAVDNPCGKTSGNDLEQTADCTSADLQICAHPTGQTPRVVTQHTTVTVSEDADLILRSAEGGGYVPRAGARGDGRKRPERKSPKSPRNTAAPKGRPTARQLRAHRPQPDFTQVAVEASTATAAMLAGLLASLPRDVQRLRVLALIGEVLREEGITDAQLAHRVTARLRMVRWAPEDPYAFAVSPRGLFARAFGCGNPSCEDGRLFGCETDQCGACAERRLARHRARAGQCTTGAGAPSAAPEPSQARTIRWSDHPWCRRCDHPSTRFLERPDGVVVRCDCHPEIAARRREVCLA